jgi:hypothetical protein
MFMNRRFKHSAISLIMMILLSVGVMVAIGQNSDGIWKDSATGLTWTVKDNGTDFNYNQAYAYCENLDLAGYSDWSLPTIEELTGLYDKSLPKRYKAKGPIELGSAGIWSSSMNNSGDVWSLSFSSGGKGLTPTGGCGGVGRALCVRKADK